MILGIGHDIVKISRIEELYHNYADKFLKRIYTKNEIFLTTYFTSSVRMLGYLAKRFAAKEAFAKALGVGIGEEVSFLDIEILNDQNNKPYILLSKKTSAYVDKFFLGSVKIHLSLSDEKDLATAMVIIEKVYPDSL